MHQNWPIRLKRIYGVVIHPDFFSKPILLMMKLSGSAFVFVASTTTLLGVHAQCPPTPIEISQGLQVVTTVAPITTAGSVIDFYNYTDESFGGDAIQLIYQNLVTAVHQDATTCETSLVVVADKPNDTSGGRAGVTLYPGDFTAPVVEDDPNMRMSYNSDEDSTWVRLAWEQCCTDGFAHLLDTTTPGCVSVEVDVTRGLSSWTYAGDTGYVGVDLSKPLRICVGGATLCQENLCSWWDLLCQGEQFFGCRDMPLLGNAINSLTLPWMRKDDD